MPRRLIPLILAAAVVATPHPAAAVNMFFMPGDAFFSASLSEESAAALPIDGGTILLKHRWLHSDFYLCGYSGFRNLKIEAVPREVATGLKSLHRELRRLEWPRQAYISYDENGKERQSEENPFHLFVYDKSFDPHRFSFGLKYNERWNAPPEEAMKEPKKGFFGRMPAIKYEKFLNGEQPVILDWRDAAKVAPLPVEVPPEVKWASMGPQIDEPAVARAADVRFFVLPHDTLQKIHERESHQHFWEVTATGFRRYWYRPAEDETNGGTLEVAEIPFDQPARLSALEEYLTEEKAEGDEPDGGDADSWLTE